MSISKIEDTSLYVFLFYEGIIELDNLHTIVRPHSEVLTQTVNNFATRAGTGLKLGPFKFSH